LKQKMTYVRISMMPKLQMLLSPYIQNNALLAMREHFTTCGDIWVKK
jgi:hypothetical protein